MHDPMIVFIDLFFLSFFVPPPRDLLFILFGGVLRLKILQEVVENVQKKHTVFAFFFFCLPHPSIHPSLLVCFCFSLCVLLQLAKYLRNIRRIIYLFIF